MHFEINISLDRMLNFINFLSHTYNVILLILLNLAVGSEWTEAVRLQSCRVRRTDVTSEIHADVPQPEWSVQMLAAACPGPCSQSLCTSFWSAAVFLSGMGSYLWQRSNCINYKVYFH